MPLFTVILLTTFQLISQLLTKHSNYKQTILSGQQLANKKVDVLLR